MASHLHNGSGPCEWQVWLTVAVLVIAVGYLYGWVRLRRCTLNRLPYWRALSFSAGVAAIWVAVASPIAAGDGRLLTLHMVQHLLLMTIAPPLVFLGEPVLAFWHATGRYDRESVTRALLRPSVQRLAKALAHPAVCWLPATATLVGWHIPALFTLAMRSYTWHAVAQASFLASGLLFWWPVVQPWPTNPDPRWSTVAYLFLATLPCDILSAFLVFSDRVAFSAYLSTSPAVAVLDDQQCAGALMWTCVTMVYLLAGAIVSTQLLNRPSSRPGLAEVV
jgi:putative membrane protein